ncbi:IS1 family transposase [Alkalibacterium putridalgicola]|nr:IS1 family transposase [Alkalibacterium putridalgicola]
MNDLKCPYCGNETVEMNEQGTDKYRCKTCGKTFGLKSNEVVKDCHTFYFSTGGFHQGFKQILIEERDSYADVTLTPPISVRIDGEMKLRITLNEWQAIKDELFNELFILSWDEEYYDPYILDGTQWELKLTFDDRETFEVSGSNAFPELFGELLEYLDSYFEQVGAEEKR